MTSRRPPSETIATRAGGSAASARGPDDDDDDDGQLQELNDELKQIRFERDSLEMRETELVEAFHEVSDASTQQAEVQTDIYGRDLIHPLDQTLRRSI